MPHCNYCGEDLRPGLKFCSSCGAPVAETLKRETVDWQSTCPLCGAKVHREEGFCGECGKPLPTDYEAYVEQAARAKRFQRKHGGLHLLWVLLPCALIYGFSCSTQWVWDSLDSGRLPETLRPTALYYAYELHLQLIIPIVLLAALVAVPVIWGIRRARAFKRLGMTHRGYHRLLGEFSHLPKSDVSRAAEMLWPQRGHSKPL